MVTSHRPYIELLGRVLVSLIFLVSGVGKVMDWPGTAGYMASKGMQAIPFFLTMAIVFELGAGSALLAGWRARWAALALIIFLIPATVIFHNFWAQEGMERTNNMHHFLKNLAIMGALCKFVADGAGRFSLDVRRGRAADFADVRVPADRVVSR
jgi:putative oxidoreductase